MGKDILYYSNNCAHSAEILKFLQSNGLTEQLLYVCVDNRTIDPATHQLTVTLPNGQRTPLPVHVTRVPTLMLVNEKNVAVVGRGIMERFTEKRAAAVTAATSGQGEPMAAVDAFKPMGAATSIGGVPYTTKPVAPLFNPANDSESSNHKIKEGEITTEQLQTQRDLETESMFADQARILH